MTNTRLALVVLITMALSPSPSLAITAGQSCEKAASDALRSCVSSVSRIEQQCYRGTGSACAPADPKLVKQIERVGTRILAKCATQPVVQAAGYGPVLTPAGLVERVQNACTSAVASLAARSYGGPQAAARAAALPSDQKCLDGAWRDGASLISYDLRQQSTCIRNQKAGRPCNTADVANKLASRESVTATRIAGKCVTPLADLVLLDPPAFTARTAEQARCLVATAHGDTTPLVLDCGPRASVPVPARGVNTKVTLPFAQYGTRCGNGSDYSFNLRLAPAGQPVERIVVHMEGGGLCIDGPDCATTNPGLFEAQSNGLPSAGMMSSTAATNPFRDWTKVGLPYCTQDLHIGGGVTTTFTNVAPPFTVHRYGALNVRAAMRYVRDLIWAEMQASDPEGYRANKPIVVFSGSSAGGYGAAYNYHWMLDDLGWVNTTAVPDAALGMDNGTFGVIALGTIVQPATFPGWNVAPFMPPYCTTPDCAEIFGNLGIATAPRLLGTPYQQILHVSNQVDAVQVNTTLFPSTAAFVNTARATYCSLQGTPGLHSFLRGASTPIHGQVLNANWDTGAIDGVLMRDWVGNAMTNPGSVTDLSEEGTLVVDYPGVQPFACDIGSPSGAFVDGATAGF